ncbi:MAG: site-specific DNA-methyltransferase [Pseudomonadota bacterium]|nr:site-specific DNA-methyltransferase [Pseudomonadota bacterium]
MGVRTKTSSFGTSQRLGHDASKFYGRNMFKDAKMDDLLARSHAAGGIMHAKISEDNSKKNAARSQENSVPQDVLNQVYCHSSECMDELPDCSTHLIVTSPPYNVGKEYDDDLNMHEYAELLRLVFTECYRVLADGGRACVNIANIGRKPYMPLNAMVAKIMIDIGYLMRGEIIWNKSSSAGVSCAWGSWKSPSNPVLRDVHEYILVFSKGSYARKPNANKPTIARDEFLEWTKSIWSFPTVSARKVGHPAPFPVELPQRLINLYTFPEDIVLDPFIGSGSTAIASNKTNRFWVGYDISPEYCDLTRERIRQCQ